MRHLLTVIALGGFTPCLLAVYVTQDIFYAIAYIAILLLAIKFN